MRNAGARYLVTMALAVLVGANAFGQQLSSVETDKLRLLYFDPTETYLVPRVIQTFHNSIERQDQPSQWDSLHALAIGSAFHPQVL